MTSSAPVKDKELQPLLARVVPIMLQQGQDYMDLRSGDAVYCVAWDRSDASTWNTHVSIDRGSKHAERDVAIVSSSADASELSSQLQAALADIRSEIK